MTRHAILTLLALTLLAGCRTRREAQPSVDVQVMVEADTSKVQAEQADTTREEITSEGGITVTEETVVTYDSTKRNCVTVSRRIDIRWKADLQSLIAHTSRSLTDSTTKRVDLDIEAEQPAVETEPKRGGWLDAVRCIALVLCLYGAIIILKFLYGLWKS